MEQPSKADRYRSILVDFLIILIITLLLLKSPFSLIKLIAVIIPVFYFPVLHGLWSQSIGDFVFNLKIVDQYGNKIGFSLALNRLYWAIRYYIFGLILANILFFIFMLFSGTFKEISLDYENESNTYLVKNS